jgi:hypothetical protein
MKRQSLLMHSALILFGFTSIACAANVEPSQFHNVNCEGTYKHHLQGICTDDRAAIFWSFTTTLVKTDREGKVLKRIPVVNHHGDLCHHDKKLYVAVNLGPFNDPKGKADSWVYVYDAADLSLLAKHKTPQVIYGAGGIAYDGRRFIVVGGLPEGVQENYVYEYDKQFKFVTRHTIKSGYTRLGIQTAAFAHGTWWFGCYGTELLKTTKTFQLLGKHKFDCGLGIVGLPDRGLLIARGPRTKEKRCLGKALLADADKKKGIVFRGN